jgi:hypothetical protein
VLHDLISKSKGEMCCSFEGVKPSPVQKGYRNKVEYTIGYTPEGQLMIGFLFGSLSLQSFLTLIFFFLNVVVSFF